MLGDYRDGSEFNLDPAEVAERRVIWTHLVHTGESPVNLTLIETTI